MDAGQRLDLLPCAYEDDEEDDDTHLTGDRDDKEKRQKVIEEGEVVTGES